MNAFEICLSEKNPTLVLIVVQMSNGGHVTHFVSGSSRNWFREAMQALRDSAIQANATSKIASMTIFDPIGSVARYEAAEVVELFSYADTL